ncbi:MAG: HAD-superfamily hydrolase, subfamily IA, variant 3 [Microgenomates group bacterium GW2011_GWC1_46_16]|uniref:Haloacid dehalogenase n=2 Tax=Candidatus Collieribacteriota TaxID=1752725 RepID=A0A1F5FZT9_9BACT|nr:MAG: hypothetical protein UX32_C0022G0011 [Microgenomates group bacterium GW2011_GWF1_46_12]KKU25646.1 MAG: HAD-superfamily hydrolase, subfamily IA, variant 3 [Microgenomates group bacterium GW2011_GWC1_46_16]KKU27610.1 MAG: hypothetical protein UX40_C0010G0011 [Microgenomates group bacterium GW2011_GWF2_46_18]KKU43657.1 MAG: hypothetical protein UX59_C0012G0010 [Microgenomates group bacterium GW2011_GWA1_46_7]KKU44773.1 MAG: hypothetical protein UX63_C0022G0004 [Microgenomates group bacteri
MNKISFVYFDVGGVVIQDYSDTNKWEVMKSELGATGDLSHRFEVIFRQYNDRLIMGSITVDDLLKIIAKDLHLSIPPDFSMLDYFVDHFDKNTYIWPIIKQAQTRTKIGLLTDQYSGMLDQIKAKKLLPPVDWDVIVDSSVEKVKKPMLEIYSLASIKANVQPSEILFIDNSQTNIDSAKRAGWQTYLYDSSDYKKSSQKLAQFFHFSGI